MAQWDELTSYPDIVRMKNLRVTMMLDTLEALQPPPSHDDRYIALAEFLRRGLSSGLLTPREHSLARSVIGPEM